MARIKAGSDNLIVTVTAAEFESYVLAAMDVLISTYHQKVHFLASGDHPVPRVLDRCHTSPMITFFHPGTWPAKKFMLVARIVEYPDSIVVVGPGSQPLPRAQQSTLVAAIHAAAERYG